MLPDWPNAIKNAILTNFPTSRTMQLRYKGTMFVTAPPIVDAAHVPLAHLCQYWNMVRIALLGGSKEFCYHWSM